MVSRTALANVLHQVGHLANTKAVFREVEEMQKKHQPEFPLLYSQRGFQYCDLLLSQGQVQEVQHRASQTLELAKQYLGQGLGLYDIGNDYLSLGRAHLLQSQRDSNYPVTHSLNFLNRAVDGLRQAGTQHHIPRALLARAEFYRVTGVLEKAQNDLDEAFTIATRGGMGLFEADCHLEYARLYLAKGDKAKAREHWETAKKMIEEMGYHRRDKEVEELEEQLK